MKFNLSYFSFQIWTETFISNITASKYHVLETSLLLDASHPFSEFLILYFSRSRSQLECNNWKWLTASSRAALKLACFAFREFMTEIIILVDVTSLKEAKNLRSIVLSNFAPIFLIWFKCDCNNTLNISKRGLHWTKAINSSIFWSDFSRLSFASIFLNKPAFQLRNGYSGRIYF